MSVELANVTVDLARQSGFDLYRDIPDFSVCLDSALSEIGITSIPLTEVPVVRPNNKEILNTAGHELNHAIVATLLGAKVASISVEPKGFSLGRTVFEGYISPDQFTVIAAAGAVATMHGAARGYSLDMSFVPDSFKTVTIQRAAGILAAIPEKVRAKAAEIIAYKKNLSGTMLKQVLQRAYLEVQLENSLDELFEKIRLSDKTEKTTENKPMINDYTVINYETDQPEDNNPNEISDVIGIRIKYYKNNRVVEETMICPMCGGKNGHLKFCEAAKKTTTQIPINSNTGIIMIRGNN